MVSMKGTVIRPTPKRWFSHLVETAVTNRRTEGFEKVVLRVRIILVILLSLLNHRQISLLTLRQIVFYTSRKITNYQVDNEYSLKNVTISGMIVLHYCLSLRYLFAKYSSKIHSP